jgi:hypothetical protein
MPDPLIGIMPERACKVVTSARVAVCGAVLTGQPRRWRTLPVSRWRASLPAQPARVNEPGASTRRAAWSCQMRAKVADSPWVSDSTPRFRIVRSGPPPTLEGPIDPAA